jgi:hypothetical protein
MDGTDAQRLPDEYLREEEDGKPPEAEYILENIDEGDQAQGLEDKYLLGMLTEVIPEAFGDLIVQHNVTGAHSPDDLGYR